MKTGWQKILLYAAIMGMEGCWLYAFMALLNKQVAGGRLSVPGILLLYPLAFVCNRLLQQLRWPKAGNWSVSWLAWALAMLLVVKVQMFGDLPLTDTAWLLSLHRSIAGVIYNFKPELLLLLSTGVVWWMGRRLAYLKVDFGAMLSEFQFGVSILIIAFFAVSQLSVELTNAVSVALVFFLFALSGISIAHAMEGTSWLSGLYQGHWSGLLLVSISLVLLLGLLIGSVITPDFLQLVIAAVKWVLHLILKVIAFLVSLLPRPEPGEPPPPMPAMPAPEPAEQFRLWRMPESVRSALRIGWTVMVIGILLFSLWRLSSDIFRWLRHRLAGMAGAEFEPLPGAFKADLLSLLKRMLSRLRGLRLPFRLGLKADAVLPDIASVRQMYRQFLRWAAAGGYPRHMSQTPNEYFHRLAGLLPEAEGDLDVITRQYGKVRYGASLPTEGELHRMSRSWHRVRQIRLKKKEASLNE